MRPRDSGRFRRSRRLASESMRYFVYQNEDNYPMWYSPKRVLDGIYSLPDNTIWNTLICVTTLICIIIVSTDLKTEKKVLHIPITEAIDIAFNILYALHVVAHLLNDLYRYYHEKHRFGPVYLLWYPLDVATYVHYVGRFLEKTELDLPYIIKITCYYLRWNRPFRFLWAMNDHHLEGSVLGTFLKYSYIFMAVRIIYTNLVIWPDLLQFMAYINPPYWLDSERPSKFLRGMYSMEKMFLTIGTEYVARDPAERIILMAVMVSGSLLVTGIAVASLALIISLYMQSEETYRARFRLIMKDMKQTFVPPLEREKVETFYRMYWHKQKGVSETKLLPTYPPTLYNTIYTDIYYEAQQKSIVLRDLSYQFLSEVSKCMKSINSIPGEIMLERNFNKFALVYVSYGDVEILTAEDDETPMLRFTRGSILNPCGVCAEVAGSRAHISIRAATFCTAHVLTVSDLWRVALKFGRLNGQSYIIRATFKEHLERVKRHYDTRPHPDVKYKSTILLLKQNLMSLKEATDNDGKPLLAKKDYFLEIADCYIMRNQTDASLIEESDSICLRSTFPCILQPNSSLLMLWKVFVATTAIACACFHPFNMFYVAEPSLKFEFIDTMATLIFIMDIFVHLSTGTKIEEGVPVTFTRTSSQQLHDFWFVLDVLAVLPLFEFSWEGRLGSINKLFKLPKVFRVLKSLEDVWVYKSSYVRLFSYCLLLMLFAWLVACMQQGFSCFLFSQCRVTSFVEQPYWSESKLDNGPVLNRTLYSIYWSLSLITFTAHKTPKITHGRWRIQFAMMFLFELCAIVHILVSSTYSATIMVAEIMRVQYKSCIVTVKRFLEKNHINPVLRHRFINYLELCWHSDKAFSITHEKKSIMFDLPQHVYQDISAFQLNRYIQSVPVMKLVSQETLKDVASKARLFYTSPNEILLNTGDICNEIYIIRKGTCEVVDPRSKQVVNLISSKNFFGDVECLLRIPSYYTVRAVTHVQVYSISRKHLTKIVTMPNIRELVIFTRQQPEFVQLMRSHPQAFLKYQLPEPTPSREFFPLPRKHETDAAFLVPFARLGFFAILRYVFPRFTIRPDGPYLRRYEWFRAFCAFLSANIFPIYYFLSLQFPSLYYIAWALDITAYFDIFQRMLVGFFNENGILVYHPASTAAHYMRGAMVVDLLASLPLEHLDSIRQKAVVYEGGYKIPSMMQLLMYNRMLQLYRLPAALDILNDYIDRQDFIFVIKAIPLFMALLLMVGGLIAEFSVWKVAYPDGGCAIVVIEENNSTSWIHNNGHYVGYNITKSPVNLILTTYYWATYELTTTGFDLFQPHRVEILRFLIMGMFVAFVMTTYFSVRVLSIRSNVDTALATFQEHMRDMDVYMKKETINEDLHRVVVKHYEYQWNKRGGTDYRTILKLCDQVTLRTEAILHIYGSTFDKCPILTNCDPSLLRLLGRAVQSMYFGKDAVITRSLDVVTDIYFVDYGCVNVIKPNKTDDGVLLHRGSLFGNINNVRMAVLKEKFVTTTNTHLLRIHNEIFYRIIQEFPNNRAKIAKHRVENESYISGSLREMDSYISIGSGVHIQMRGVLGFCDPKGKAMQIYLILVSILCIYTDIYNAAFQNNHGIMMGALYALDVAFLVKIFVMIYQPVTSDRESLYFKRKAYILGEFKYDLASCLPIELFCLKFEDQMQAWAYLRLNRFLRVVAVNNAIYRYKRKLFINLTMTTIISTLIWFALFVHVVTCIWYKLSVFEDNAVPKSSWKYKNGKYICKFDYLCSLYFILNTFTQNGISDILPRKQAEVLFTCILMILSTMMYMLYVGEFSNIIQYQFFRCLGFYKEYLELQEFLKNNRLSENLVKLTKMYTVHLWREARGLQLPHFLVTAPQCLRLDVMSAAYIHHFTQHPVFKDCEREFLRQLAGAFQHYYYLENMYVVREGEITNAMYFIHKGKVEELKDAIDGNGPVFRASDHFGLQQGLYPDVPYTHTYKTVIKSQVLTLKLHDWAYLLELYPNNKRIIYKDGKAPDFSQTIRKFSGKFQSITDQNMNFDDNAYKDMPSTTADVTKDEQVELPTLGPFRQTAPKKSDALAKKATKLNEDQAKKTILTNVQPLEMTELKPTEIKIPEGEMQLNDETEMNIIVSPHEGEYDITTEGEVLRSISKTKITDLGQPILIAPEPQGSETSIIYSVTEKPPERDIVEDQGPKLSRTMTSTSLIPENIMNTIEANKTLELNDAENLQKEEIFRDDEPKLSRVTTSTSLIPETAVDEIQINKALEDDEPEILQEEEVIFRDDEPNLSRDTTSTSLIPDTMVDEMHINKTLEYSDAENLQDEEIFESEEPKLSRTETSTSLIPETIIDAESYKILDYDERHKQLSDDDEPRLSRLATSTSLIPELFIEENTIETSEDVENTPNTTDEVVILLSPSKSDVTENAEEKYDWSQDADKGEDRELLNARTDLTASDEIKGEDVSLFSAKSDLTESSGRKHDEELLSARSDFTEGDENEEDVNKSGNERLSSTAGVEDVAAEKQLKTTESVYEEAEADVVQSDSDVEEDVEDYVSKTKDKKDRKVSVVTKPSKTKQKRQVRYAEQSTEPEIKEPEVEEPFIDPEVNVSDLDELDTSTSLHRPISHHTLSGFSMRPSRSNIQTRESSRKSKEKKY